MTILHDEPKNVIYGLYCTCYGCKDKPELIRYVGQTFRGASVRFYYHKCDAKATNYSKKSDLAVYRWMRKHGVDNIVYKILQVLDSPEELNDAEIFWIKELDTFGSSYGLNLSEGGSSLTGYKHSEETKAKLRGRIHTDETRKRMSDAWKKSGMTEARIASSNMHRLRISGEKSSRAMITESSALQIKEALWNGEPMSLVAKQFNVSKNTINHINKNRSWKHVPWPIGPRQKMRTTELRSEIATGRKHSDETRAKMSESAKAAIKRRMLP